MNETQTTKKKSKVWILPVAVLLVLAIAAGVYANWGKIKALISPADTVTYTLTINVKGETVKELELKTEKTVSLLDAMKENLKVVENGGFVTAIEGHEQNPDASEYWTYTVNGEMLMVGAADYYPANGDKIIFSLDVISF
ncbi:MAG: DUF4430 domain-containing protein [Clostridia bacterium]|nr:DUF4430 domain-containing protein [Clostridia bacterium]